MDNLNTILKDRVISEINTDENTVVIHLKPKEKPLPKSWEEFCEMFSKYGSIFYIDDNSEIKEIKQVDEKRFVDEDKTTFSDRATAEAVLALCQLIQLRNCYNGDWVPEEGDKYYCIMLTIKDIDTYETKEMPEILYFKTEDLRDEFLRNFRDLIEILNPLYGIKKGGEE